MAEVLSAFKVCSFLFSCIIHIKWMIYIKNNKIVTTKHRTNANIKILLSTLLFPMKMQTNKSTNTIPQTPTRKNNGRYFHFIPCFENVL
jgi:hypothetical protein